MSKKVFIGKLNCAWLQIGYKNCENTEKVNIFRKYDSRKPRKHAICHTRALMESRAIATENVPYYKVKTPLQRIVQVFKRHAEVMFEQKMEYKSSSIVITTLSTKAYRDINEIDDFWELLKEIISLLENKLDFEDG